MGKPALLLVVVFWLLLLHSLPSNAQNILNPQWNGNYNLGYWGGTTGGQIPNLGGSTFYWGYGGGVISNTIAINEALQDEGVQVEGYSYVWQVKNGNANEYTNQPGIDDFIITVDVYEADGTLYQSYSYDYGYSHDWTNHSGSETFPDQFLDPAFFGNMVVNAEGNDTGYWAGHWGPEFSTNGSSITLTYSSNPCYSNPLYDPACDGYAEAMAQLILEQQELALASIPEPIGQEEIYEEPTLSTQNTGIPEGSTSTQEQITISNAAEPEDQSDDTREEVDTTGVTINSAAANDISFILNNIVGGILNDLETNQTQSALGMESSQAQGQGSSSSNQSDSEERLTTNQKLKQAAKERAAGLQKEIVDSNEMNDQQVAQAEMLAMMSYVPGFDTYKIALAGGTYPDVPFYPPTTVPDSPNGKRNNFAQQLLHQQMVDMQYEER